MGWGTLRKHLFWAIPKSIFQNGGWRADEDIKKQVHKSGQQHITNRLKTARGFHLLL
jgi:hypothetical protein